MAIMYKHPTTGEPVEKERWRWVAIYRDIIGYENEPDANGDQIPIYEYTELHQFEIKDNQAIFHPFADIDQSRLWKFKLQHDIHRAVVIWPPAGAKVVYFYVNGVYNVPLDDGEHNQIVKEKGYKLGYIIDKSFCGLLIDYDDSIRLLHDMNVRLAEGIHDVVE